MRTLLTSLHSKYIHPSLALPCLAAYCGQDCGELLIREYTVHQPKENLLAQLLASEPEVICFSVYIWNRNLSLELARALKIAQPQLRIVMGGPEVSFEEATFFAAYPVDALICGEGEIPLRQLLFAWSRGQQPDACPGLQLPGMDFRCAGQSLLEPLDLLPSPFAAGLAELSRGYVYYESSRGCPYSCSFCMSSLDTGVRSFSLPRIEQDLALLMGAGVEQIKFVDRTFNFHAERSREIFSFILRQNRHSRFHFEIGADLLDEQTLQLLETVPAGMFQFEIGVQTTSELTLDRIGRKSSLAKLKENIRRLLRRGNIQLHLDLIAGLPGESAEDFYASLEEVLQLTPHHLQVELVKLLPGSPLRNKAGVLGLYFDPTPPYSVLGTPDLDFCQLEQIRGVGRLLDQIGNSGRFRNFLQVEAEAFGGLVAFYRSLQVWWQKAGLFEEPQGMRQLFEALYAFCRKDQSHMAAERSVEALARDFARAGRVVPGKAPDFLDDDLTAEEQGRVKQRVKQELDSLAAGEKLQHFAAVFKTLQPENGRSLLLYLYRSGNDMAPSCMEVFL